MSSTAATTTTEEGFELPNIPNEWFDYFYHQQFMDDLDVPFVGGSSLQAVSDNPSFDDDVVILGSDDVFDNNPHGGFESAAGGGDETMFAGTATTAAVTMISPENSTGAGNSSHVDLSPKAGLAKQVKRRSRSSRKSPKTLLNASIKNFRTVVQQYTGFQSSNPGFIRNGKGPVTLSFGPPKNYLPELYTDYYNAHGEVDRQQMIDSFTDY